MAVYLVPGYYSDFFSQHSASWAPAALAEVSSISHLLSLLWSVASAVFSDMPHILCCPVPNSSPPGPQASYQIAALSESMLTF